MHVKFLVLLLKIKEEKLWKHFPLQRISWSFLDQICQCFLNLWHLKTQLINLTFCCFTQVSSDMITAESKTTSSHHTPKYERKCFFLFFWCNPSTDFLHQVCQSQTPCKTPADQVMDCSHCRKMSIHFTF